MKILVLNTGSSSLKCELYQARDGDVIDEPVWEAKADWEKLPGPATLVLKRQGNQAGQLQVEVESLEHTVEHVLRGLTGGDHAALVSFDEIGVTGHRVVHGGSRFRESTWLTDEVRRGIRELTPFAPLHNPLALEAIEAAERVLGSESRQVVVFDTSFHATLPPRSYLYPGPREWERQGVRRYGFHGISHQYVSRRAGDLFSKVIGKAASELLIINCHLGNGCSLCAIRGGISVETTMGFTPLEGLMMGSRSGTIDPGLLLYLQRQQGRTADELDHILNYESGLKGLSGLASDMRQVEAAAEKGNTEAREAMDVYTYRLAYFICSLLPALGGLDLLVFTAGVGENSRTVRARTCEYLRFLGLSLDPDLNSAASRDGLISRTDSKVAVAVLKARENLQIARECARLLAGR